MNIDDVYQIKLEQLKNNMSILPDKPEENHSNTLNALWMAAANNPISVTRATHIKLPELSAGQISDLDDLINKRLSGVPLAHLTGRQSFMGIEMLAGPEALIPRKETEILATTVIDVLSNIKNKMPIIIDVCTGAGNIAVTIAKTYKCQRIYAADISQQAIELAKRNAIYLQLDKQIDFLCGDLLEPFKSQQIDDSVDLITCNPPYISSSKVSNMAEEISVYEPSLAFDGGAFGVNLIRRLITDANIYLKKGGYLIFEVGLGQAAIIIKQVEKSNIYENIISIDDQQANPRVIVAQKI